VAGRVSLWAGAAVHGQDMAAVLEELLFMKTSGQLNGTLPRIQEVRTEPVYIVTVFC
jgi:hypothetical protein